MIPVAKALEPAKFDASVRVPGDLWLQTNAVQAGTPVLELKQGAGRPPALWTAISAELADAFSGLCGYAAMLDPTGGSVDHYFSCDNYPYLTYEWENYRFASNTLNASKKKADADVLDPFEVGVDWFEIILPSLQMQVTAAVPAAFRAKAEYTLTRLKLRDGERVIRWRNSWYKLYQAGDLTLPGLRKVAPLLAAAVEKAASSPP